MKNRVREIREAKGMSQFDLVVKSNTPQGLLSMIETGKLAPWPAVVARLSKALKVPPAELFPEEKEAVTR